MNTLLLTAITCMSLDMAQKGPQHVQDKVGTIREFPLQLCTLLVSIPVT